MQPSYRITTYVFIVLGVLLGIRSGMFILRSEVAHGEVVREIDYRKPGYSEGYAQIKFQSYDGQTHIAWLRKGWFRMSDKPHVRYILEDEVALREASMIGLWGGTILCSLAAIVIPLIGRYGNRTIF